jgi:hypothetical protein
MFAPDIVMQSDLSTDRRPKLTAWIVMDVIDYLDLASFRLIVIVLEIAGISKGQVCRKHLSSLPALRACSVTGNCFLTVRLQEYKFNSNPLLSQSKIMLIRQLNQCQGEIWRKHTVSHFD